MERNFGFSVRESGVGGILVVVPIARLSVGGSVGRRVRICDGAEEGDGKIYFNGGVNFVHYWSSRRMNLGV